MGLEVLDKISVELEASSAEVDKAITEFSDYIRTETQALALEIKSSLSDAVEIENGRFQPGRLRLLVK